MLGKQIRVERMKNPGSGRIFTVAVDHAPSYGVLPGIEDIQSVGWKEIAIKRTNEGYEVHAPYSVERRFVANVYLLVKFDKSVVIQQ
jgi:DhnA family fructose-bisphosphate aldolase class Ia